MSTKIVVVGSINLDLVTRVTRMPQTGETLTGQSLMMISGGKGANQAVAAARLGGEVEMIGRLGNDTFAETLRRGLEHSGVGTRRVRNVEGASGAALITVVDGGGNSIVVVPGANGQLRPGDLDEYEEELRGAAVILAQLEIPLATVEHLGEVACRLGVPFILDPAPAQRLSAGLSRTVTWLTPNESETATLLSECGFSSVDDMAQVEALGRAADQLLSTGVCNVALKLGERGTFLAGKDVRPELIPAFKVEAIDSTAAGDAFNGGFSFGLVAGMEPRMAARFANGVAAISVTRRGAQPSMPTFDEVRNFLSSHGVFDPASGSC